jgi:hypothetical protein
MKKLYLLYALLVITFSSEAQNINVAGVFPTIDHSGDLTGKAGYSLYYFGAFPLLNLDAPELKKDANFILFYSEQAVSYNLTQKFSLTGSYVYQRENAVYDNYVNENRFYFQAKYKHSFKKLNFVHRLRFDGRFIQNRVTNETPFTHRARYLFSFDFPISGKSYVIAYEEAFFNTFENASAMYGENWAYAAYGCKLNKKNKIEAGILYVTWNIGKSSWFNQYYFQLTWINHLDFRKKDE